MVRYGIGPNRPILDGLVRYGTCSARFFFNTVGWDFFFDFFIIDRVQFGTVWCRTGRQSVRVSISSPGALDVTIYFRQNLTKVLLFLSHPYVLCTI